MNFDLSKKHCYYFNEISKIPRGSRNEKGISDYIVNFAKEHGFTYRQDEVWNVIVNKPAAKGYEKAEPVILQAHIDMVCEKNKNVEHDFEKDPLELYVDEEGWLHAKGTTLGADDGHGVAYMLAILDEPELPAPALQCVFTAMEEIGLLGAIALDASDLHAKRYINLDAGGENQTCVSCSGGARAVMTKKLNFKETDAPAYQLQVRGLKGGHSGGLIHLERGNAILLAARILEEMADTVKDLRIADFNGGLKFNAIPREADITFVTMTSVGDLNELLKKSADKIKAELQFSDEGFFAELVEIDPVTEAIGKKKTREILDFLTVIPNGLQHRSMAIEGLTTSSLNAGVAYVKDGVFYIDDLIRSAAASHSDTTIRQLEILCPLFGFEFTLNDRYYGWEYEPKSKLREILRKVLKEKGIEMKEKTTHGGLECGVFRGKIPGLDIVTYGPISTGEHTPDEKMDLASFDRAYENLVEVLKRCK
ncbi:MAG: beta-Ala-His dipeptidase [Erysipelotrichaceae bacterium]|nr:beta-Ala-His dipeptidase [Erysipelotrichaceae bacterium]MBR3168274.1 beta-Ala-His dipeptidase [Erysipelotrichaceae bacterium]